MLTTRQIGAIMEWAERHGAWLAEIGGVEGEARVRAKLVEIVGGEGEPTDARARVDRIVADLSDRRGLGGEWEGIDDEIRDEIVETWTRIVGGGP